MRAQDYLKQLQKLEYIIENKMFERERWRSIAQNTSSAWGGERVQSAGDPQKMTSAIDNYLDIEAEIKRDLAEKIAARQEIINTLEQLPPKQYDVLHKIYVQYLIPKEAAAACGVSKRTADNRHKAGLANVQKILDERERQKSG